MASCEKENNSGRMFPIRSLYVAEGHCRGALEFFSTSKDLKIMSVVIRE